MDWATFALITYAFLLSLALALIILISRRKANTKYAKGIEEKELKLSRMQIDIEETMDGLNVYAEQLRDDWKALNKQDQEGAQRLHKRMMEMEAALYALRARVTALEVKPKAGIHSPAIEAAPQPEAALPFASVLPKVNAPLVEKIAPIAPKQSELDGKENKEEDIRVRAISMLEDGEDVAEVARRLGISHTEMAIIHRKLMRR